MRKIALVVLLNFIALTVLGRQPQTAAFRIVVLEGEGALNNVENRAAAGLAVRVLDRDGQPVVGANVQFDAPANGPGESFAGGSTHFSAITDANGIAATPAAQNNGVAGPFATTVHVSYQGQAIGQASIRQTNVSREVAGVSNRLQGDGNAQAGALALSGSVVGIASGDQFLVNGAPTPGNANLLNSTRVETLSSPTTLFLHDHCEFLEGPHSSILVAPNTVTLETGAIRARHFGNCKIGYGGLWVRPVGAPDSVDGVVSITQDAMQIASVSGELQVVNGVGEVLGAVAPGTVSSFPLAEVASGATVGGPPSTATRNKVLLGTAAAAGLAALGLAIAATATSSPTSP